MPDEYLIGIGIVGKQPPVPIGSAAVKLSGPNSHIHLTQGLVKARGRWGRNVAARNGVRARDAGNGPSCVSLARQLKREESLRNSAVWFCGLSCQQRTTRPPAFGYPAKDQAKAGGRVCRVMSMLVLDKLYYREIGSCAHVALLRARPVVWGLPTAVFGCDWSYEPSTMENGIAQVRLRQRSCADGTFHRNSGLPCHA